MRSDAEQAYLKPRGLCVLCIGRKDLKGSFFLTSVQDCPLRGNAPPVVWLVVACTNESQGLP